MMLKVKDILYLQDDFVRMARHFGAYYPEDVVQNVWILILRIESEEGDLTRIEYEEGKVNLGYIFKTIFTETLRQNKAEDRYTSLTTDILSGAAIDDDVQALEDVMDALDRIPSCDKRMFMHYMWDGYSLAKLGDESGRSPVTMFHKIRKIKGKILDKMQ